ncbi:hypothetical protein F5B20DRAFT_506301 [Whalleya microplaca]|nr:hypothetical protein F5B20DRAFT_506301 [Whalleya microplaca]
MIVHIVRVPHAILRLSPVQLSPTSGRELPSKRQTPRRHHKNCTRTPITSMSSLRENRPQSIDIQSRTRQTHRSQAPGRTRPPSFPGRTPSSFSSQRPHHVPRSPSSLSSHRIPHRPPLTLPNQTIRKQDTQKPYEPYTAQGRSPRRGAYPGAWWRYSSPQTNNQSIRPSVWLSWVPISLSLSLFLFFFSLAYARGQSSSR